MPKNQRTTPANVTPASTKPPNSVAKWTSRVVAAASGAATVYGFFGHDPKLAISALLGMIFALVLLAIATRAADEITKGEAGFYSGLVKFAVGFVLLYFMAFMCFLFIPLMRLFSSSNTQTGHALKVGYKCENGMTTLTLNNAGQFRETVFEVHRCLKDAERHVVYFKNKYGPYDLMAGQSALVEISNKEPLVFDLWPLVDAGDFGKKCSINDNIRYADADGKEKLLSIVAGAMDFTTDTNHRVVGSITTYFPTNTVIF